MQRPGRRIVAFVKSDIPQAVQRAGHAPPVPQFPPDCQTLLVQRAGGGIVTLIISQYAGRIERLRARLRSLLSSRLSQDPHTPLPAL